MKIIPMEDFVLKQRDERKSMDVTRNLTDFRNSVIAYAKFLKTPIRHEHFCGAVPFARIQGYFVNLVEGKNGLRLFFVPEEESEGALPVFSIHEGKPFSILSSASGAELTDHGVKLIFG